MYQCQTQKRVTKTLVLFRLGIAHGIQATMTSSRTLLGERRLLSAIFFIFLLFLYLIIIIPCVIHTSNLQTRLPRVSLSINSFSLDIPLARMLSEHDHFNIFVIILDRIYVNSNIRLAKNSELLSPFSPFAFHCNISVFFSLTPQILIQFTLIWFPTRGAP